MWPTYTFNPQFKRLENNTRYSFQTKSVSITEETSIPFRGVKVGGQQTSTETEIWTLPEACTINKEFNEYILNSWYADCKKAFLKPLNLDVLLKKIQHAVYTKESIPALTQEEEESEWFLIWTITHIELDSNALTYYWAPTEKQPVESRIEIEVQSPEETQYRIIENTNFSTNTDDIAWVQDITQIPLSDRPALRLEAELDASREKFRRRIRDSRLRAKLAKYRAERLAQSYFEKYGVYPTEDMEEAQTEYESSSDESE
jgi:hypothetical protein